MTTETNHWLLLLKLEDPNLSKSDRRFLLHFLVCYSDARVVKSLQELSEDLGFSKTTITKVIAQLELLGYLNTQQLKSKGRGRPKRSLAVSKQLIEKLNALDEISPLFASTVKRLALTPAKVLKAGQAKAQRLDLYWVMAVLLANTDATFWVRLPHSTHRLPCGVDLQHLASFTGLSVRSHYNHLKQLRGLRWIEQITHSFDDPLLLGSQAPLIRVSLDQVTQDCSHEKLFRAGRQRLAVNEFMDPLSSVLNPQDLYLGLLPILQAERFYSPFFRNLLSGLFGEGLASQLLNRKSMLLILGHWSECLVLEFLKHLDQKKLLELMTPGEQDDRIIMHLDHQRFLDYIKDHDPLGLRAFFERQHQVAGSLELVEDKAKEEELGESLQDAANALASDDGFVALCRQCFKPSKRQLFATKESESQESQKQAQVQEEAIFDRKLKEWRASRKRVKSLVLSRLGGRTYPLVNGYKAKQGRLDFEKSIFGEAYKAVVNQAYHTLREILNHLAIQHEQHLAIQHKKEEKKEKKEKPVAVVSHETFLRYLDSILAIKIDYSLYSGEIYLCQLDTDADTPATATHE